jgi:hypothetical protein
MLSRRMAEDDRVRDNYRANWPSDRESSDGGTWVRIPAPPPVLKSETVWHYTTTAGLIGILTSGRLWATAASVLNDATELRYGLELAESSRAEYAKVAELHSLQTRFLFDVEYAARSALRNNAIYVACASRDGDDLGQWRGYADSSGYALGVRATPLCAVVSDEAEAAIWENQDLPAGWHQVLYDPKEQDELLMSLWDFAATIAPPVGTQPDSPEWTISLHTASSAVTNAVAMMKHPSFWGEQEVRLAFDATRHAKRSLLRFRQGRQGITPYVELGAMPRGPSIFATTNSPGQLSLDGVRVGPNQDRTTAEISLNTLLRAVGQKGAEVTHSAVPYR